MEKPSTWTFVPSEAFKETRSDDTSTARNGNTNRVLWLSVATNKIRKWVPGTRWPQNVSKQGNCTDIWDGNLLTSERVQVRHEN